MKLETKIALAAIVFILGIASVILLHPKTILVQADSQKSPQTTRALTVGGALHAAGIALRPGDVVEPALSTWLNDGMRITVTRALHVDLFADGSSQSLITPLRAPVNILAQSGVQLGPGDRLQSDGVRLPLDQLIPTDTFTLTLEVARAVAITVKDGNTSRVIHSAAPTLGEALAEAGISLGPTDHLQPEAETPISGPLEVILVHGRPVFIQADGQTLEILSPAATVSEALTEAGITLGDEDYSLPPPEAPLPSNGQIKIVRVRVEITQTEEAISFETQTILTPQLEIDSSGILQTGKPGLRTRETHIRYEDGQMVSSEAVERITVEPQPQIIGYGTKIVIRTLDTPAGKVKYWRKVAVYATSYSPCHLGTGKCNSTTASGMPLRQGVIGTSYAWYKAMVGQSVYVPGYGTAVIADYGGVPGYWIDLGYSDEDFVGWHQNTTLYFLTPVPPEDQILWILP